MAYNPVSNRWFTPQSAITVKDYISQIATRRGYDYWDYLAKTHTWPAIKAIDVNEICQLVGHADIVMWSAETWQLVNSGLDDYAEREFPEEIAPESLVQLWILEDTFMSVPPDTVSVLEESHRGADMVGVLVIATKPSGGRERFCGAYLIFENDKGPIFYSMGRVVIGEKIGSESIFAAIAAGLDFMSLPIVSSDPAHVSRQMRREYERKTQRKYPEVRVVNLRKRTQDHTQSNQHKNVDWQCRWFVTSHRRHYPSGKVAWVPGYIKGPDDKPIKAPTTNIFRVVR